MKQKAQIINLNNLLLKILALIYAYLFWLIIASNQKIDKTFNIPLCFYGLKENLQIIAQDFIVVNLNGKRSDLQNLNINQEILSNIDVSQLGSGNHSLNINENNFFLHDKIKLLNYYPTTISVQIKEKK